MATAGVLDPTTIFPLPATQYDDAYTNARTVLAQNVIALRDSDSNDAPRSLMLVASKDVMLEAE